MIVYIRHGHDDEDFKFSNHMDDVKLLPEGWQSAQKRAEILVRYFRIPTLIICSPFQRARNTARSMVEWIQTTFNVHVPIELDCNLSRLFHKDEQDCPDVHPKTARYNIPIKETRHDFEKRVAKHIQNMLDEKDAYAEDQRIWCISHSVVLLQVAELHHRKIRDPVRYLDWFDVNEKPCEDCLSEGIEQEITSDEEEEDQG